MANEMNSDYLDRASSSIIDSGASCHVTFDKSRFLPHSRTHWSRVEMGTKSEVKYVDMETHYSKLALMMKYRDAVLNMVCTSVSLSTISISKHSGPESVHHYPQEQEVCNYKLEKLL